MKLLCCRRAHSGPRCLRHQGGGSRKKGKKKGKAEPSEEPHHQAPETEAAEAAADDCVPAGRVALLDMGIGGHTSSAAHV